MKLHYLMFVASAFITAELSAAGIKLHSNVLPRIDGIPGFMDRDKVYKSVITGRMIMIFMNGGNAKSIPIKEIEFQGKKYPMEDLLIHKFENKVYSLKALAEEERKTKHPARIAQLKALLENLKNKFHILMSMSLNEALGTKSMMLPLIKESCHKRNIPHSLLIKWGEVKEGKEQESLQRTVTSFPIFYTFCTDLINFMQDVIENCPKARKQYEDWKKNQPH